MTTVVEAPLPPAPPPEEPPLKGGFERVAGALFAPVVTFREIARKPDLLVPLLVIVLIAIVAAAVMAPRIHFESTIREQMAQSGQNMSEEDMERAVRIGGAVMKVTMYFAPLLNLIFLVIIAAVLLLAFRLMGGEGTFKQAVSVTAYSWMPLIVQTLFTITIVVAQGKVDASELSTLVMSNLGFLVSPTENAAAFALLNSIDAFTIWALALFIIGFSFVSQMTRVKSAAIILTLWAILIVAKVGLAALGAARAAAA